MRELSSQSTCAYLHIEPEREDAAEKVNAYRILKRSYWSVSSVSYSPDGRFIATEFTGETVKIW